jgi:hypothetical protein
MGSAEDTSSGGEALVPVPEGTLLVEQRSVPWLPHTVDSYRVERAGALVTPERLAKGTVVRHGESVEVTKTRHNTTGEAWMVRCVVRNDHGHAVIEDGEREARRQFAREQIAHLAVLGFSPGRAARIMRAAGPGQVRQAVAWAYEARDILVGWSESAEESLSARINAAVDALDVVLSGAGGTYRFGFGRMAEALRALGLPVPCCFTAHTFFGVLAGAKEALLAGLPERGGDALNSPSHPAASRSAPRTAGTACSGPAPRAPARAGSCRATPPGCAGRAPRPRGPRAAAPGRSRRPGMGRSRGTR